MTEPNYEAERKLPVGLTCADCGHGPRCDALFGAVRRRFTSCDFWPSRFIAQGIEAGTGETAKVARPRSGESPVPERDALKQLQDLGQQFDEADAPAPCGKGGTHDPHP